MSPGRNFIPKSNYLAFEELDIPGLENELSPNPDILPPTSHVSDKVERLLSSVAVGIGVVVPNYHEIARDRHDGTITDSKEFIVNGTDITRYLFETSLTQALDSGHPGLYRGSKLEISNSVAKVRLLHYRLFELPVLEAENSPTGQYLPVKAPEFPNNRDLTEFEIIIEGAWHKICAKHSWKELGWQFASHYRREYPFPNAQDYIRDTYEPNSVELEQFHEAGERFIKTAKKLHELKSSTGQTLLNHPSSHSGKHSPNSRTPVLRRVYHALTHGVDKRA